MKKALLESVLLITLALTGCGKSPSPDDGPTDPYAAIDRSHFNGIDEPLVFDLQVDGFDADVTLDLARMLGVKTFRLRLPDWFVDADLNYNTVIKENVDHILSLMKEYDIEPIGQCCVFPSGSGFVKDTWNSVPRQNDEHYGSYMEQVESYWRIIAGLFPDVTIWEMGNESNANTFFHPNGYVGSYGTITNPTGFGYTESAHILTDYMFHASKGVHEGNAKARSLMPGITSCNDASMSYVSTYLDEIYASIESGDYPSTLEYGNKSTEVDDYFDILGWHPYVQEVNDDWLEGQKSAYNVVKAHDDEGRPVIFTEFGFTDFGDTETEARQSGYFQKAYEWCQNDLPFIEKMCAFRMYDCKAAETWGGVGETTFGFFKEPSDGHGFSPKNKAYSLQNLYGGSGDLAKYY